MDESKYYTIDKTGSSLDGLDVQGKINSNGLFEVLKIRDRSHVFGDRPASMFIEKTSLFLHTDCLSDCSYDEEMEFASDNPFGKYVNNGSFSNNNVNVQYEVYEKAVTVSVYELLGGDMKKYHFCHSFFDVKAQKVLDILYDTEKNLDLDSVIFDLEDLTRESE